MIVIIICGEITHPTTSGEWKQGVDPHTFKWNLLQAIILQELTTNQWMDLITNILPVDTTDPDSDWKDLSSKTCVRILMQMAGSVCSCSAQNCHFLHLHLYLTNVLKKHFYFLFPGIHEVHLDPHRNTQSTILCPATTLCYL